MTEKAAVLSETNLDLLFYSFILGLHTQLAI